MKTVLPNLELVVYKAQEILSHDQEFIKELEARKAEMGRVFTEFDVDVFPQIWGSTCTAFDVLPNGEAAWGGMAMTKEYTVIVHEQATDSYCVFFGERPCYKVTKANHNFMEDMKNHSMVSLSKAKERY